MRIHHVLAVPLSLLLGAGCTIGVSTTAVPRALLGPPLARPVGFEFDEAAYIASHYIGFERWTSDTSRWISGWGITEHSSTRFCVALVQYYYGLGARPGAPNWEAGDPISSWGEPKRLTVQRSDGKVLKDPETHVESTPEQYSYVAFETVATGTTEHTNAEGEYAGSSTTYQDQDVDRVWATKREVGTACFATSEPFIDASTKWVKIIIDQPHVLPTLVFTLNVSEAGGAPAVATASVAPASKPAIPERAPEAEQPLAAEELASGTYQGTVDVSTQLNDAAPVTSRSHAALEVEERQGGQVMFAFRDSGERCEILGKRQQAAVDIQPGQHCLIHQNGQAIELQVKQGSATLSQRGMHLALTFLIRVPAAKRGQKPQQGTIDYSMEATREGTPGRRSAEPRVRRQR